MFSKLSNKTLVIVLLVLGIVIYLATISDHSDSSYRNEVINIDSATVTNIKVDIPDKESYEIVKEKDIWFLKFRNHQSDIDQDKVKAFLAQMSPLRTIRVATNSKKSWKKYGVDSKAAKISFFKNSNSLATLYLGGVNYEAPESQDQNPYSRGTQGRMIGYARTDGDNTVYVVDGYLKLSYCGDTDSFKKKVLIDTDPKTIDEVDVKSGSASFTLVKNNNQWMIDGQVADSATTTKFVSTISRLRGYEFIDKDISKGTVPVGSVTVKSTDAGLFKVDAYPADSTTMALVSNHNHGNIIKDKNHQIFDRLFKEKNYFLKK